jgi:hypothetical protein
LRDFVCPDCRDHQGFGLRSDREHIELWRSFLDARRRAHQREVSQLQDQMSQLQDQIADLQRQLEERPEKVVERWIGTDEITAAETKAQRAYRSREYALQGLTEIRLLHREADGGKCRCGKRFDLCPEAQIVSRYPVLIKWEKDQYERLRRGEPHALPANHPAIVDPHWRPE